MTNENVDFNESEEREIKQQQREKMLWLGDPKLSWKRRIFQMIATLISFLLVKFGTNLRWQFSLVGYLLIVCPIGTYQFIKWIINLF